MRACMNGNGPPIRVAGDTANLEIVELASVPVSKCLLRTKYDNCSRRIPWDVRGSQALSNPQIARRCVNHMSAARGLAGLGQGRERTIYYHLPTVQSGIFRHVRGSRTIECLAKRLKSR